MTGETRAGRRSSGSVQPGGRPPAPGRFALVQSFINSHYDLEVSRGADLLASPDGVAAWLARHGLIEAGTRVTEADHRRAVTVREGLRTLAARTGGAASALAGLNAAATGAPVELRFAAAGPDFALHPGSGVDGALGLLLGLSAEAMLDGSWARLKICPGHDCGWAFYDRSRNQTSRWCSMSVCGGRAKARAHYRRRQEGSA